MYLFASLFIFVSLVAKDAKEVTSIKELRAALSSKLPVCMLFYAPWCNACKSMQAPFNKAAQQFDKSAILIKINAEKDEFKDIVDAFEIEAIPTLIIKHVGVMDSDKLTKALSGFIAKVNLPALKPPQKSAPKKNIPAKKTNLKKTAPKKTNK